MNEESKIQLARRQPCEITKAELRYSIDVANWSYILASPGSPLTHTALLRFVYIYIFFLQHGLLALLNASQETGIVQMSLSAFHSNFTKR